MSFIVYDDNEWKSDIKKIHLLIGVCVVLLYCDINIFYPYMDILIIIKIFYIIYIIYFFHFYSLFIAISSISFHFIIKLSNFIENFHWKNSQQFFNITYLPLFGIGPITRKCLQTSQWTILCCHIPKKWMNFIGICLWNSEFSLNNSVI